MKKKILVIEDESYLRELFEIWLADAGFQIIILEDGRRALDLSKAENPDLFLIDTLLPGIDGLEICRILRDNDRFKNTPILLMSAVYTDMDFILRAKKVATDFIKKPFTEIDLIKRIKLHLKIEDSEPITQTYNSTGPSFDPTIEPGVIKSNDRPPKISIELPQEPEIPVDNKKNKTVDLVTPPGEKVETNFSERSRRSSTGSIMKELDDLYRSAKR